MAKYEVTTWLLVEVQIKIIVEADGTKAAIDAAANLLPQSGDHEASAKWKAEVILNAPKGIEITKTRAVHFQQASGAEKARKV